MRFSLLLLLVSISACDNARVKNLENENASLISKIDSMESMAEANLELARERYAAAEKERKEAMDSVIIAQNLKVIRLNEACGTEAHGELLRSVKNLEQKLAELGIEVTYMHLTECGYEFHDGPNKKIIGGTLTEMELVKEFESFFGIKIPN